MLQIPCRNAADRNPCEHARDVVIWLVGMLVGVAPHEVTAQKFYSSDPDEAPEVGFNGANRRLRLITGTIGSLGAWEEQVALVVKTPDKARWRYGLCCRLMNAGGTLQHLRTGPDHVLAAHCPISTWVWSPARFPRIIGKYAEHRGKRLEEIGPDAEGLAQAGPSEGERLVFAFLRVRLRASSSGCGRNAVEDAKVGNTVNGSLGWRLYGSGPRQTCSQGS